MDGFVYAQPPYLSKLGVPIKGAQNVVRVATENDHVYAFDANSARVLDTSQERRMSFINLES